MFEMLVALEVHDKTLYEKYRQAIAPLLEKYQGQFTYDVDTEETALNNQFTTKNINRIFTLRFTSETLKDEFFNDKEYLKIKQTYFDKAVKSSHIISTYHL